MNKDMKRYFNECKYLFSYFGKKERQFLTKLMDNMEDGNHKVTYNEIVERLGTPQEIITEYYEQEGIYGLINKAKIVRIFRNVVILFLVICTLFFSYKAYIYQKTYDEVKNSQDGYYEEVIEVIE